MALVFTVPNFMIFKLLRWYSFAKKFQSQNVSREKLVKTLLYEKVASKMLMKLTPAE